MFRRTILLALALLALAVVAAGCGNKTKTTSTASGGGASTAPASTTPTTAAGGTTLNGTVGPGFDIKLVDASGNPVTSTKAGSYTITIDDQSNIHNFHLTGPGVDKSTKVETTGKETWTVDLKPGTYTFVCDPHASTMKGSITVA